MKLRTLLQTLETKAPSAWAEDWDNVGLLVGDPEQEIRGAVVGLDLTAELLAQAEAAGANLVITHHPCIFPAGKGLSKLSAEGKSALVFNAIRKGIAVVSLHTNFDRAALEVVERIASGLGALPQGRLFDSKTPEFLQLVVYVPKTHAEIVRQAVCAAGAGQVGFYDQCSFSAEGEGTFRGLDGATPFAGKVGELERVQERRLEVIVPIRQKQAVQQALHAAHPYEEVAHSWIPLAVAAPKKGLVSGLGYGFWGEFEKPVAWAEFCARVAKTFGVSGALVPTRHPELVKRVAFSPGKGTDFLSHVSRMRCDAFITGEVGYHPSLQASQASKQTAVLELGHTQSEFFFPPVVQGWLENLGVQAQSAQPALRFGQHWLPF